MPPAIWRRVGRDLAAVLFPTRCLACARWIRDQRQRPRSDGAGATADPPVRHPAWTGAFCSGCRDTWTPVASPLCPQCGVVFKSRIGPDHRCGRCQARPGPIHCARAAGIYDHSLRSAVHALKFSGRVALAQPLGALLGQTVRRHWPSNGFDLVAPVPLHRRRLRRRGFNQAYLLIRHAGWPADAVIVRDMLSRIRATQPQTGLDRRQRRANIKNAFVVNAPARVAGKRVLLVDDVLTTGATVEACAVALLQCGAAQVDAVTVARAL